MERCGHADIGYGRQRGLNVGDEVGPFVVARL